MKLPFWSGFFKALGFEFKEIDSIQGKSGIDHKIIGLALNEERKTIVIVQNEQDARILSMAQVDIEVSHPGYNILMIRPIPINLSNIITSVGVMLGSTSFGKSDLIQISKPEKDGQLNEVLKDNISQIITAASPQFEIIQKTNLNVIPILKETIQQLGKIKFINNIPDDDFRIDIQELFNFNPVAMDVPLGNCCHWQRTQRSEAICD